MPETLESRAAKLKKIGGRLSLDFINTVGGRDGKEPQTRPGRSDYTIREDKIESYTDLVAWSVHAGTLTESEARGLLRMAKNKPSAANSVFKTGIRLRETLYRIFASIVDGLSPNKDDVDSLNRLLATARAHERLTQNEERFVWTWDDKSKTLDSILWKVARSASELLTSDELPRVRQCGGESCGWLFLDTSKNRSRQWCDMRDCGNLSKVRRFRRRQQADFERARE